MTLPTHQSLRHPFMTSPTLLPTSSLHDITHTTPSLHDITHTYHSLHHHFMILPTPLLTPSLHDIPYTPFPPPSLHNIPTHLSFLCVLCSVLRLCSTMVVRLFCCSGGSLRPPRYECYAEIARGS